jgi:hypothetical protein
MRTGVIEANLAVLNDEFRLPYIPELIERKVHGAEKGTLESSETELHRGECERPVAQLEAEGNNSQLPDEPVCRKALNDLLVRIRLKSIRLWLRGTEAERYNRVIQCSFGEPACWPSAQSYSSVPVACGKRSTARSHSRRELRFGPIAFERTVMIQRF